MLILALIACSSTVQPLARPGTTDTWLEVNAFPAKTLSIRAPHDATWSQGPPITLIMPEGRWGQPKLTLEPTDSAHTGSESASLANGTTVSYTHTDRVANREATATLEGWWTLEGKTFALTCTHQAEAENGADARWCLPILASARWVDPKP